MKVLLQAAFSPSIWTAGFDRLIHTVSVEPKVLAPPEHLGSIWESAELAASFMWVLSTFMPLQLLWEDKMC